MQTVNTHAAKTQLSRLIDAVAAGEEVVIARAGRPVARLVPVDLTMPKRRRLGGLAHLGDIPDDYDDALPPEMLALFEGS